MNMSKYEEFLALHCLTVSVMFEFGCIEVEALEEEGHLPFLSCFPLALLGRGLGVGRCVIKS